MKINSTELFWLEVHCFAYNAFNVWCMLRGGGLMKNILHRFIVSQTHFGMPRGAKMSLALNEPK